ncbi:MAG TPA: glycosyltransferase family 2 protein [Phycisphaerales bacterium]|nr:glycosyltransferase family 2 protein [Phycisphaerales bacterium]
MPDAGASAKLPVSVAIVCKNSAATIGRTIDATKEWAAEIVALDSGSTDATIPLLEAAGARVVRTEWLGHVKTKQKALEAASQPWVLSLDSDESPEPALVASIRGAVTGNDARVDGYTLNRKVFYDGRFLHHAWQPERRLRLVRNGKAHWQGIDPHDQLVLIDPSKTPGRLDGDLRHDSFQTFEEQLRKQVGYARLMAGELVARGDKGSYWRLLTSPPSAFLKQLILKQAYRDGWAGWLAAAATSQQALMKHALIIELARKGRAGRN